LSTGNLFQKFFLIILQISEHDYYPKNILYKAERDYYAIVTD